MDHHVLNAMVGFVYMAIIKDALVAYVTYYIYKKKGKEFVISRNSFIIKTDFL